MFLAALALTSWAILASADPYHPVRLPVLPNTATCFLALGAGILALVTRPVRRFRWESLVLGLATAVFGALALLETTHQISVRMNELFAANRNDVFAAVAARVSPVAALDFVLSGLAMALLVVPWRGTLRPILLQALISVPLATAFVGLLDGALRSLNVVQSMGYESLTPALSLGFVLFSVALTSALECMHPQAALLFDTGVQGKLVRRVAPIALAVLTVSTGAGLIALDRGWVTPPAVLALVLVINGLCLSGLLAVSASHFTRPLRALQSYLEEVQATSPAPTVSAATRVLAGAPQESAALHSLGEDPGEFHDIARLLDAFMEQRRALIQEVGDRRRAEQALRDSESKYRLLLESFPQAVAILENGTISFANPAAARLLGLRLGKELVGTKLLDLVFRPERPRLQQLLDFVSQGRGGASEHVTTYLYRRRGEEFAAEIRVETLPSSGTPTLQLMLTDVSEEQRQQQYIDTRTRRLEVLLKKTTHLFAATDLEERLRVIADAIRALGWMRVSICECDADLETTRLVTAGFTAEEETEPGRGRLPATAWRELFTEALDDLRIGDFINLPGGHPWMCRYLGRPGAAGTPGQDGWSANDPLLVAPMRASTGEILGILILEEPIVDAQPTAETLEPISLFVHLASSTVAKHRDDERLRQSEETLRRAQEIAHVGNWDLDLATNELQLSAETRHILGLASDGTRLAFAAYLDRVHPDDREILDLAFRDALRTGELRGLDHRIVRADASERIVHLQAEVLATAGGRAQHLVGTLQDVSERLRTEAELREALERADSVRCTRSQLLEMLGQEVRAYMYAVDAVADDVATSGLSAEQRQRLELMQQESAALGALLDEVLDFALVEAGKLQLEPVVFDLQDSVHEVVQALAPRALESDLDLAYHVRAGVPGALLGDAVRLRQVLHHLLDNALRFTPHGEVLLEVGCDSRGQEDVCLHFEVHDSGIGIAPERHGSIFVLLGPAADAAAQAGGHAGLGLAIAARLVMMMGGRIWLESAIGQGSVFHFTARFRLAPAGSAPATLEPPASWNGRRVLVVEGKSAHRHILDETLRGWRLHPTVVDGVRAAHAAVQAAPATRPAFDLALVDATLPGTAGMRPAQEIQHLLGAAVPLILTCSAGCQGVDCDVVGRSSPIPWLTWPIHPKHLLQAVAAVLDSTRLEPGSPPAVPAPSAAEPMATRSLNILLVEDNVVSQKLARRTLERRGHRVVDADDGRSALAALRAGSFDVILMDLQMPGMDGLEATAAIREGEKRTGEHLRILAMTAHAMKGDRERCLAAGMDGYLAKPIQLQQFLELVEGGLPAPGTHSA